MDYNAALQSHVGLWSLLIVLFLVTFFMLLGRAGKGAKILHMIVRLFYILVLLSGLYLVASTYGWEGKALLKGFVGILVFVGMEMVLVRTKKRTGIVGAWIFLIIVLALVFYLGYVVLG